MNWRKPQTRATLQSLAADRERNLDIDQQAIELALADLGIHAKISEIVRTAKSIKQAIIRSRVARARQQLC